VGPFDRLEHGFERLRKNSVWEGNREGHEFHSCRKFHEINAASSRWGKATLGRTLFPQPLHAVPFQSEFILRTEGTGETVPSFERIHHIQPVSAITDTTVVMPENKA
jgi:hypothetical protein